MSDPHTPGLLKVVTDQLGLMLVPAEAIRGTSYVAILEPRGSYGLTEGNAKHLVQCWNAHMVMKAALWACLERLRVMQALMVEHPEGVVGTKIVLEQVEEALVIANQEIKIR